MFYRSTSHYVTKILYAFLRHGSSISDIHTCKSVIARLIRSFVCSSVRLFITLLTQERIVLIWRSSLLTILKVHSSHVPSHSRRRSRAMRKTKEKRKQSSSRRDRRGERRAPNSRARRVAQRRWRWPYRIKVEEGSDVEKVEGALTDTWSSVMDNERTSDNSMDWFSQAGMSPALPLCREPWRRQLRRRKRAPLWHTALFRKQARRKCSATKAKFQSIPPSPPVDTHIAQMFQWHPKDVGISGRD